MAMIMVDSMILKLQAAALNGAGASLTENAGFSVDDIGGMPAAKSIADVIGQLEKALEAYQELSEQNSKRIMTISTSFQQKDQSLSS